MLEKIKNFIIKYEKYIGIMISILLIIILPIYNIIALRDKLKEKNDMISYLGDTLNVWKEKDNLNHYKISVLETTNTKSFLELQTKDNDIRELQSLVSKYKNALKEQGNVTIIKDIIHYVSLPKEYYPISGDTIVFSESVLLDTIDNKWIKGIYGFDKGISTLELSVMSKYNIIIGRESQGLFKKSKPYAEVFNYNPYANVQSIKTYQVSLPKVKRFGIGPYVGYGFSEGFKPQLSIGIGLQYNLIRF